METVKVQTARLISRCVDVLVCHLVYVTRTCGRVISVRRVSDDDASVQIISRTRRAETR